METYDAPWRKRARCLEMDPQVFFPSDSDGVLMAKKICERCPVKRQCLEYAFENGLYGVWGGTSERERRRATSIRELLPLR